MLDQIKGEIGVDPYYKQNYANDGQRFVAWYLRRVLLRSPVEARQAVTDGADDKQIDAVLVDDDHQRVLVLQGKFIDAHMVDGEPLREVLSAWMRLKDLPSLQKDCNDRLKERLEAVRKALEDEYQVEFELLTTGSLTDAARDDLAAFSEQIAASADFPATLHLVDSEVLASRLAEAESQELPTIDHRIKLDAGKVMSADMLGTRSVIAAVSLRECLNIPGITDGRLFRKNVRQFLSSNNKVNRDLRNTLRSERVRDFFFYHNGITALCQKFDLNDNNSQLTVEDLSVVNGCQSLTTIYSESERIRSLPNGEGYVLFRFYEIPQRELADRISIYTNSQSAVKPRDLRSNDRVMLSLKKAYESVYKDGFFITQRGTKRPADCDVEKTVDCAEFGKALMAWQCQRPNIAYNEKRLFDEYYKTLFRPDYDPQSILALQTWMNAIDRAWPNLTLNDALKAGKSYVRFHLLYAVSALIAQASGHDDKVAHPAATLPVAQHHATEIISLGVNCLNEALKGAMLSAQVADKVFSPQNWSKNLGSVQAETLATSTVVSMLAGFSSQAGLNTQDILTKLKVPAHEFGLRWMAE